MKQVEAMTSPPVKRVRLTTLCILFLLYFTRVDSAEFTFGGEAKRVCKAYKMICPANKICALQSIGWPHPMKFPVCVHRKEKEVKTGICMKAPQPGRCRARFLRWYYNVHMQACSWFAYSGCGGNQNNFRSLEDCTRTCIDENATEPTSLPYGRLKTIYKEMRQSNSNNINETDSNSIRRIPVQVRAPEVINFTRDVTASFKSDSDPFANSEVSPNDRKALKKLARKLRKQEMRRKRRLEREKRRRLKEQQKREKKERKRLRNKSKVNSHLRPSTDENTLPRPDPTVKLPVRPNATHNFMNETARRAQLLQELPQSRKEERNTTFGNFATSMSSSGQPRTGQGRRKLTRKLTPEELGPGYYRPDLSRHARVGDMTAGKGTDPSTRDVGRFRVQKWIMDEKFNVGRRRRRRKRRRRRRRHKEDVHHIITSTSRIRPPTLVRPTRTHPGYQPLTRSTRGGGNSRAGFFEILNRHDRRTE